MEWNDETIGRLRGLWAEGHSTAEIGRRLGVSKNAVVGKAHRLGLSSRPSPIRREGVVRTRAVTPRRITGPTLPPLPASAPTDLPALARPAAAAESFSPSIGAPPALPRVVAAPRVGRLQPCCWPLGEPGTRAFRFCDAESLAGKPYCAEHAQVAYVRVRDRREEAA